MGNNATKEARTSTGSRPNSFTQTSPLADHVPSQAQPSGSRPQPQSRSNRSRHDGILGLVGGSGSLNNLEQRRETKPEREARKAAKERAARLRERERSLKEEGVDGGYLVTLGTYTGPEDFSKPAVRQLMLERRLAPFWRGLNDHSDSWTEYQLVAAARGLPIPAADDIPTDPAYSLNAPPQPSMGGSNPIPIRPDPSQAHLSAHLQDSPSASPSPLFRGRSKTLASLSSKNDSQTDVTPQEIQLPHESHINGQPLEARLYKDPLECPICFLYYPPFLNRTRCCDQPICSECFVQIKRPDPHPPEHLDPNSPVPEEINRMEQEGQLISEPATCPFCVQEEFGVTYEAPPFRRGLAYANNPFSRNAAVSPSSLSSSASALAPYRRRGQSISAGAPGVITTDRVRPDWAMKLSEARAQAARRSAAATALHTAAYQMGGDPMRLGFGRRRRYFIQDPNSGSGEGMPIPNIEMLLAALQEQGSSRGRRATASDGSGGRASRSDEIEELMMLEAIRQSLAAEEDRKRKEDKEAAKLAKKEEKQKAKEQKKLDKAAKKGGLYASSSNASSFFSSVYGSNTPPVSHHEAGVSGKGKGKAPTGPGAPSNATMIGFNPLSEPTSTLNKSSSTFPSGTAESHPQINTQDSNGRSIFDSDLPPNASLQVPLVPTSRPRNFSDTSSSASSVDGSRGSGSGASTSLQDSHVNDSPLGASGAVDSPVTFGSLAGMIDRGDDEPAIGGSSSAEAVFRSEAPHAQNAQASGKSVEGSTGDEISSVTMASTGPAKVSDGQYDHKEGGYFSITEQANGGQMGH